MPIVVEKLNHVYMTGSALAFNAVEDVSLTVNEREFLCVIGHTGSGKSTLVQHFNGLMQPSSGRVVVDGADMCDKKMRRLGRQLVGMVFQYPEYQLFEETVFKDIAFGPKNMGLSADEISLRVADAMRFVGLDFDKFAEKSPFDLSGGEKRRAALAGIIAMHPKYLVLDEPMAGLDPSGRRSVLDMLVRLQKENGTGIVMVSHSMDDIARVADRVAVMNKGRLVMCDTPENIFNRSDELVKMGLDVPQAVKLTDALLKRGVDLGGGLCTEDELFTRIMEITRHV
ncbi:MAG: energy-coupling factor transporter ATPase [Eubacteriales bacterium]|nr:energy-coupling factor transporter ATPase [Clostridiales bacterium]MDY5732206.1 energy-coupling factor transporter ATPase [Eubacteriales bacterium]